LGRVGRGHRDANVFVQTYQPDNPVLHAAINRDWQLFYDSQIKERQLFMFPPFCHLLKLTCARKTREGAMKAARDLRTQLYSAGLRIEINGPAPSFYELRGGSYHWQLIIKSKQRQALLDVLPQLPSNWIYDLDPINLL
jgi:primosomal protein N' (replication factor Y)